MLLIRQPEIRRMIKIIVPFLGIPLLALAGSLVQDGRVILLLSFAAALLSLLLFAAGFEKKAVGSRRMVIVSVMTALCFVGRFLPFLKPIIALTILTAVYLGKEAGFLVGTLTALLTNFYFGQGPWTVFQMLAWGMIGYFAGVLESSLKHSRTALLVYGAAAGALYSFMMDVWTVLWYQKGFVWEMYLSALVTAIPYTLSYMLSAVLFLAVLAKPFGDKLERLKIKYGV